MQRRQNCCMHPAHPLNRMMEVWTMLSLVETCFSLILHYMATTIRGVGGVGVGGQGRQFSRRFISTQRMKMRREEHLHKSKNEITISRWTSSSSPPRLMRTRSISLIEKKKEDKIVHKKTDARHLASFCPLHSCIVLPFLLLFFLPLAPSLLI